MPLDSESFQIGRDRITRVFRYLEALNQHRNPARRLIREQLWVLWFHDLPDHPSVRLGLLDEPGGPDTGSTTGLSSQEQRTGDDFILKVQRPTLTRPPTPPDTIIEWLERGWEDPGGTVSIRESRNEADDHGGTRVARFEEDSQRLKALEIWKSQREQWAQNELPARAAAKVFEQLYELYGRIEREAEGVELIVGDGILSWRRPEGGVFHPVLLQRLQLEFDPGVPEFTVVETEHEVELYSALFQSMPDVDGRMIARCREELRQGDYHPLGGEATSGFMRRLVNQLSARGEFTADGAPRGETDDPRIGRDPGLFLRARTLGFATAIEAVLEDVKQRQDLTGSLLNVVGVEPPLEKEPLQERQPLVEPWSVPEEVLFSKPANIEQIRIAERLEQHGSVLVQGPPGTGKTHTIANPIGHLLAKGKSVLVISHTTKALRVLRQHVVEQLRPLCVSVLESDIEGRKQLESSVEAIVERLSTSDARRMETEADRLAAERRKLLEQLRHTRQNLLDARAGEYRDITVAGQAYSPADAARKVAAEMGRNDWIPGPAALGAPLPLSEGEVAELYRTNDTVSLEDEVELSGLLPPIIDLPMPGEFERLVEERTRLARLDMDFRPELWGRTLGAESADDLALLAEQLRKAVELVAVAAAWQLAVLVAGQKGGPYRETWEHLLSMIAVVCSKAANAQESLLRHAPALSDQMPLDEQQRIILEILEHLKNGGGLGWITLSTRRTWKRFLRETTVSVGEPRHVEHFHALMAVVKLRASRRELAERWDRQIVPLGGPVWMQLGDEPEAACAQFSATIRACMAWHNDVWQPLERKLKTLGFRWEDFLAEQPASFLPHGELLRLRDTIARPLQQVLAARVNVIRWDYINAKFEALADTLALSGRGDRSPQVVSRLANAVRVLDPEVYQEAFERLVDLQNRRIDLERRRELLARLEPVAPSWASAIRDRRGPHSDRGVPGDVAAAWLWRQLHDELERRLATSLTELQQTIQRLSTDLIRVTTELTDRRAWAAQVRRTTLPQRQALVGWLDTRRRIGGGFGRRVPRLRVEATRRMSECRDAVPVWIMPLARAVESFDPRTTRFDVVIIDEASQSDIMALLAFYLARNVVVVGDHEQVSPAAVGQDQAVVQHLIDEHLQGIPNAVLYDGRLSVYDLARQSFGGTICLLEHFRCVPEIIQFSNHLSYEGRIRPLRDPSLVQLEPHVIAHRITATPSEGKVNREEALVVAALLVAATEQPEYQDKTFGVISLVGDEQALEIERILLRRLTPREYELRRMICGNAAHFQGDERDVMFLSVVDTTHDGPLPLREQPMFKQRFNVAASRACDQMWVVHSLDPRNDLKPGDLRRRLIEYAEDPTAVNREVQQAQERAESELERAAIRRLVQAGYRVRPQWRVGYYRIDLVVEGGGRRLAVECDGDRYHPIEKLQEDMARQAILERLGWTFVRVRGSHFFRDPDGAMKPVYEKLEALEIRPEPVESAVERPPDTVAEELKGRVIRRAYELRRIWLETS